ncbi:ATP-binding cassette domain-containing protein [Mesorhizobium sp. M1396]
MAVAGRGSRKKAGASPRRSELAVALRSCRSAFVAIALFSGMINILMLSGSIYMLEVYDRVLPSRSLPTLVGLSLLLVILYGGQGLLDFIRGRILVRIGGALDEALGPRIYASVLRLPLKIGHTGDGNQPIRDLDSVRGFLSGAGPTALFDLPWIPLYLIVIFAFHVVLGMVALLGAIVLVLLTIVAGRLTRGPVNSATRIKAAGAHDLIVGFRDGYETQIGELGEAVSAGQRQRIALARALYRDPFLVVLDEPNSNLDAEGEQALFQAIVSVRQRGGIVVLVAHRPSALGTVDFILAMNQGRVQAFGPKDEVLAKLFPRPQPAVAAVPRLRLATEEPAPPPVAAAGE